jgi:hypothetical protein
MPDHLDRNIRPAHKSDGAQLFEIRWHAILAASPLVAQQWSDAHPPEWIYEVIAKRRVWEPGDMGNTFDPNGFSIGSSRNVSSSSPNRIA